MSGNSLIQNANVWQSAQEKIKAFAPWEDPDGQSDDDEEEFKPLVLKGGEEDTGESTVEKEDEEHSVSCSNDGASSVASTLQQTLVFGCAGGFLLGCLVSVLAVYSLASFNNNNENRVPTMPQHNDSLQQPFNLYTNPNGSTLPYLNHDTTNSTEVKDNANDQNQVSEEEPLSMTETKPKTMAEQTHEITTEELTHPVTENTPLVLGTTQETFQTSIQKLAKSMEVFTPDKKQIARSNELCKAIRGMEHRKKPNAVLLYNITAESCRKKYGAMEGTGNVVLELVGKRLAAFAEGKTSLIWDCGEDAFETRRSLVYPWISGYFPAMDTKQPPMGMALPTMLCPHKGRNRRNRNLLRQNDERTLNVANTLPLKFMNPLISHDLRRMAIAMVGVPNKNHPSAEFEQKNLLPEAKLPPYTPSASTGAVFKVPIHDYYENGPLFPDAKVDDVAIHFRCGDVLMGAYGPFYYPRYEEYTNLISPEARTIGIVTQAFAMEEGVQARGRDSIETSGERCRVLVEGFVDFMKERLPKAKFSIHNGPEETITLAYARLIMANQTFGLIPSTFSTFPVLASFGTGYLTKPVSRIFFLYISDRTPTLQFNSQFTQPQHFTPLLLQPLRGGAFAGMFLNDKRSEGLYENQPVEVEIQKSNMMYCQDLKRMWDKGTDKILEWFRTTSSPEG